PSHVTQIIPPFSLWWVAMVHDYALWRDDLPFVRGLMPGVREVLDRFLLLRNVHGLVAALPGWNFMDWCPEWRSGVPPDGELGVSGLINWQLALVLTLGAQLEEWLGEAELAARARRAAGELARRITEHFWDGERGLFADDLGHGHFSEHSQCLAILSGLLDDERSRSVADGLLWDQGLVRTTIYFTHYLFETYAALGRGDMLLARLQPWLELPALGFKTTFEMPEPSRSDCHAWGAHPLLHYYASILGIRPAVQGFRAVEIRPRLGPLTAARGSMVHPRGTITVDLRVEDGALRGEITLPHGVPGTLIVDGRSMALVPGHNRVEG
ncbi:MAG TPA: alpha-L-rhamnosidase C-terminal domain-containing protein, partial [Herpetosiphonaceae bacterium]|nr:alpha-L-rhamnosidase C-terminal domain-containing protein [Herpetosiphonaceae bacterium]